MMDGEADRGEGGEETAEETESEEEEDEDATQEEKLSPMPKALPVPTRTNLYTTPQRSSSSSSNAPLKSPPPPLTSPALNFPLPQQPISRWWRQHKDQTTQTAVSCFSGHASVGTQTASSATMSPRRPPFAATGNGEED